MWHRLASRSLDAETTKQGVETALRSPKTTLLHDITIAKAGLGRGTVDFEASGSAFVFSSFNDSHRRMRRGRKQRRRCRI
jgi:hypothetical protein